MGPIRVQGRAARLWRGMNPRQKLFSGLLGLILVAGAAWEIWHILVGSHYEWTDDAYVGGDVADVTPLMAGTVSAVAVSDTESVAAGQVLVRLADDDALIDLRRTQAEFALAQRQFAETIAKGEALRATVTAREAELRAARAELQAAAAVQVKARIDLQRRQALLHSGAISADELTTATAAFADADAAVARMQARVGLAEAARSGAEQDLAANLALTSGVTAATSPTVLAAAERVANARLEMDRTVIRAPFAGIVSRRQVQIGQHVAAGEPLMTIVPVDKLYVDANFKESQLGRARIGQDVRLTSLLYGSGTVFHGHVVGIGGGTGAAFAVIPAQNATGNWIKVTQRLPVRIALDPNEMREHPLRIGLSMEAELYLGR